MARVPVLFRRVVVLSAVTSIYVAASGCATRQVGILTTALPPSEPIKPNSEAWGSRKGLKSNPLPGERLVDVVQILESAADAGATNQNGQTLGPKSSNMSIGNGSVRTEADLAKALVNFEGISDSQKKKQIRNLLFSQMIDASINNCSVFLTNVRGSQIGTRTFFDISTGLLAGAAGITRPESSAKVLAALGAFSNGAGASIDRNVFSQVATELVIRRIEGDRYVFLDELNKKKTDTYEQWDLGTAMTDASRFHWMCTMAYGLSSLEKVSSQNDLTVAAVRGTVAGLVQKGANAETIQSALAGLLGTAGTGPGGSEAPKQNAQVH